MLSFIDVRKGLQLKFIIFLLKKNVYFVFVMETVLLYLGSCKNKHVANSLQAIAVPFRRAERELGSRKEIYRKRVLTSNLCTCLVEQTEKALQCAETS